MASKAYGTTIKKRGRKAPPQQVVESLDKKKSERVLSISKRRGELKSISDKVANHSMHHANWFYEKSMILFPDDPSMRFVHKYYPYAENGPLYVDEPSTEWDVRRCEEKSKVLKDAGLRYFFVDYRVRGNSELSNQDAQIENAMEQLGEI